VTEPLHLTVDLRCTAEHAFRVWTTKLSQWWPADHTVTGAPDIEVFLEGRVGGLIFERTPAGVVHEWGEITAWEPPQRLRYLWYLRQDRADASEVEITFVDLGATTRVEIVHSGWERMGAAGPDKRQKNVAGWRGVLPHFVAACDQDH
jgi:uncharacterized protein YndB with AHSA1/START domain